MDRTVDRGTAPDQDPPAEAIERIRRRLLAFYDRDRRDLPWRDVDDPYRTWISEVMLQQTRVESVIPYYRRWMERFPGVDELAAAELDEVLQEWKGLGYYSRARNLHRAARLVRERHRGRIPSTPEELRELPGVGEYTAGAVASIAFGVAAPAVDGNARRVLARLFDLPDPGASRLRKLAAALVDRERPGAFNQAVMELGATICTPRSPDCDACPLEGLCVARARDTVTERPAPRRRTRVREAEAAVVVPVDRHGRTLLLRRPEDGLLGGMWEFPAARLGEEGSHAERLDRALEAAREIARTAGARLRPPGPDDGLPSVPHVFSHLKMTYHPSLLRVEELSERDEEDLRVLSLDALEQAPLPVAQQKIAALARDAVEG